MPFYYMNPYRKHIQVRLTWLDSLKCWWQHDWELVRIEDQYICDKFTYRCTRCNCIDCYLD